MTLGSQEQARYLTIWVKIMKAERRTNAQSFGSKWPLHTWLAERIPLQIDHIEWGGGNDARHEWKRWVGARWYRTLYPLYELAGGMDPFKTKSFDYTK